MYKVNEKILQTPVEDGKILLLEPEAGSYFEMNEVSVLIYQAINEGLEEPCILEKIISQYDIEHDQASKDLKDHLDNLSKNNIIIQT